MQLRWFPFRRLCTKRWQLYIIYNRHPGFFINYHLCTAHARSSCRFSHTLPLPHFYQPTASSSDKVHCRHVPPHMSPAILHDSRESLRAPVPGESSARLPRADTKTRIHNIDGTPDFPAGTVPSEASAAPHP